MQVLANSNMCPQKRSVLQERIEDILSEMTTFKTNLTKKIQIFEETKDDLIKEANDLETITKDKKTWVAEIQAKENSLLQKQKELDAQTEQLEKEKSLIRQQKINLESELQAWENEKKRIAAI